MLDPAPTSNDTAQSPSQPITEDHVALVRKSFARMEPDAGAFADLFFDRLFEIDVDLKDLFRSDRAVQKKAFMSTLTVAVKNLGELDSLSAQLRELGNRHAGYGITGKHFITFELALLWTLEQALRDEFTDNVWQAWRSAYRAITGMMQGQD